MRTRSGCSYAESGIEKHRRIDSSDLILNHLPEDIVANILSRLPTKNAVQTSILSKSWEHKWKSIKNLWIDDECNKSLVGKVRMECFLSFVDRVLALTGNSEIDSFRLSCTKRKYNSHGQALTRWIGIVLERKVKTLDIKVYIESISLHQCLPNWSSLTELKLSLPSCTLEVPTLENCVGSLKILHLVGCSSFVIVNTGDLLVLTFPVLEELVLRSCIWPNAKSVEIRAPALIAFKKSSCRFNDLEFKICGDKLAKFQSDCLEKVVLEAPSVYNVAIDSGLGCHNYIHSKRSIEILNAAKGIKFLKLDGFTLLALFKVEPRPVIPTFHQVKHLELTSCRYLTEILDLLQLLPNVESLILTFILWEPADYIEQVEALPSCIGSHLKEVKLREFYEIGSPVELAQFILKNASNLERMSVVLFSSSQIVTKKLRKVATKMQHVLSSSPRRSRGVSIVVTPEIH